jgi:F-type H+-transporting ATPase subunit epsilon
MRLGVSTPLAIVVEADNVASLRAEDETGAFGILPGHADFLTALAVSVVSWRDGEGGEHYVAVRGGMLEVRGGGMIDVATPEAVASDDLHRLETEALAAFRRSLDEERTAHVDAQRLYLAAIRQICRFIRSDRATALPSGPSAAQIEDLEP